MTICIPVSLRATPSEVEGERSNPIFNEILRQAQDDTRCQIASSSSRGCGTPPRNDDVLDILICKLASVNKKIRLERKRKRRG